MAVSRAQILRELLPGLENLFGMQYKDYMKPQYKLRCVYGKYRIYQIEYDGKSTTLAKGLSKEAAQGMMKLLVDPND